MRHDEETAHREVDLTASKLENGSNLGLIITFGLLRAHLHIIVLIFTRSCQGQLYHMPGITDNGIIPTEARHEDLRCRDLGQGFSIRVVHRCSIRDVRWSTLVAPKIHRKPLDLHSSLGRSEISPYATYIHISCCGPFLAFFPVRPPVPFISSKNLYALLLYGTFLPGRQLFGRKKVYPHRTATFGGTKHLDLVGDRFCSANPGLAPSRQILLLRGISASHLPDGHRFLWHERVSSQQSII